MEAERKRLAGEVSTVTIQVLELTVVVTSGGYQCGGNPMSWSRREGTNVVFRTYRSGHLGSVPNRYPLVSLLRGNGHVAVQLVKQYTYMAIQLELAIFKLQINSFSRICRDIKTKKNNPPTLNSQRVYPHTRCFMLVGFKVQGSSRSTVLVTKKVCELMCKTRNIFF